MGKSMRRRLAVSLLAPVLVLPVLLSVSAPHVALVDSSTTFVTQNLSFTADDGVVLSASVGGFGDLSPRPLIVEDSPYAPPVSSLDWSGPNYNYVELQWRGTGTSGGSLDSAGPRDQEDLSEFLGWACQQSWSDGHIGLYGFSASAIIVYNSMHLPLACVDAASLMSGTVDLYRDLLYIGGIPSPIVGSYVEGSIIAPWLEDLPGRIQQAPASVGGSVAGFATTPVDVGANLTEDQFWQDRTFEGDVNHIPVLADDGFYDVEERGAFQAFSATVADGSHLLVMGAHDGFPAGTPGPFPQYTAWFDHYVRAVDNGVDTEPTVDLDLSNGSYEQFLADNVTNLTGSSWPLTGTDWTRMYLSSATSGTVQSINDGTLSLQPQPGAVDQAYPFVPSVPSETDPHSTAAIFSDGIGQTSPYFPPETDMQLTGPTSLTYTSSPLQQAVNAVGPVGLDVYASSTQPLTDLVAVVADVWPDGTAYPVATGQLRTSYPDVDVSRSLIDSAGDVVDPYNEFDAQDLALPGTTREYHVEILPIGNHFGVGHRIRLYIVGTPADMQSSPPGVNTVGLGGVLGSRLIFPTVGTTLAAALGQ